MPQVNPQTAAVVLLILGSILGAWVWVVIRLALRQPVLPASTPRIVPWGGLSVLMVAVVTFVIQITLSVVYFRLAIGRMPVKVGGVNPPPDPKALMTVTLLANAVTLVIIPSLLRRTSGATRLDFGVRLQGLGRQVIWGVVTYPLLFPVVFGAMGLAVAYYGKTPHPIETAIASSMTPGMALVMTLSAVVGAPVVEELLFRGVLLGWLTRVALGREAIASPPGPGEIVFLDVDEGGVTVESRPEIHDFGAPSMNPYDPPQAAIVDLPATTDASSIASGRVVPMLAANVATSLVFAGMHAAVWPTPIPLFFLSLGLGMLYQRTGGILAPIALHMTFNGVSTLMMFLALGSGPAAKPPAIEPVPPPAMVKPVAKGAGSLRALGLSSPLLDKRAAILAIMP